MNKISFLIILSLVFCVNISWTQNEDFRKNPPSAGKAPKIEVKASQQFKLGNGLRVILVEDHKIPTVSFKLLVDRPIALEKGTAGLSILTGQLLRAGTTTRSKAEMDEAVDFIGADLITSDNSIAIRSLSKHKDVAVEIMADILLNPAFSKEEFDKIKEQAASALAINKENPTAVADNVSDIICFGAEHPYGEVITEGTVSNITLENCQKFHENNFRPGISYLVMVGDISLKEAEELAEKYFSQWKSRIVIQNDFELPKRPAKTSVAMVNKSSAAQSVIHVTYPIELKPGSEDRAKALVLNTLLGTGPSSRLFKNVREDKGYTYDVRSRIQHNKYVGQFSIVTSVRQEVTDSAIAQLLYEMKRLRTEKVDKEELETIKAFMKGAFARQFDETERQADYVLDVARYRLPKDFYKNYLQRIEDVSVEDIQEMALKYLHPDAAHILVVGNKDGLVDKLKQFDGNGEVDFYNVYGRKIEKASGLVPPGMSANRIIEGYLRAIGGKDKINQIEDVSMIMKANIQGNSLEIIRQYKMPGKYTNSIKLMGNVVAQEIVNNKKGVEIQGGKTKQLSEAEIAELQQTSALFPELLYLEEEVDLELVGIEDLDGKMAYKIFVTFPNGNDITTFYDTKTFIKLRTITTRQGMGQKVEEQTDYNAYKEVDGVKFPQELTISGLVPIPIKSTVEEIKVNSKLSDDIFEIKK